VLAAGGATATLEGSIWEGCGGGVTWTPGGTGIPAGASLTATPSGTSVSLALDLPEPSYAELLAAPGGPVVTLSASAAGGPVSDVAQVAFDLDATGLVALGLGADVATLAEGELAVLTARIESRVGAPLGQVRVTLVLQGLATAGPARVRGANKVSEAGGEVLLDALPPAGNVVVIQVPVRGTGRGGSASAEARSSGGHLLTPPAARPRTPGRLPGCGGCGAGGAEGLLALLALAAVLRRVGARRSP
jgi:hypothetical protein